MHQGRDIYSVVPPWLPVLCFLTNLICYREGAIIYIIFRPILAKKSVSKTDFRPLYRLHPLKKQTTSARPWLRGLPDLH